MNKKHLRMTRLRNKKTGEVLEIVTENDIEIFTIITHKIKVFIIKRKIKKGLIWG